MAEKIRDLLQNYEDEGGELYWTKKQKAVLEAIKENPGGTRSEIAKMVAERMGSCHQSYVSYVLENAEPEVIRELRKQIEEMDEDERAAADVKTPPMLDSFGGSEGQEMPMGEVGHEAIAAEIADADLPFGGASSVRSLTLLDDEGFSIHTEGDEAILEIPVMMTLSVPTRRLQGELGQILSAGDADDEADEVDADEEAALEA